MTTRHTSWDAYPSPAALPPPLINDPALPLISIVTPSYNQGRYIRATIESVLNQSYPNIEYHVIDGGSSDETLAILRDYAHDPRFHWISEHDRGQSDAINKGWSRCRGAILAWLNSDDSYKPDIFHTIAAHFVADADLHLLYGHIHYMAEDGRLLNVDTYAAPPQQMLTRLVLPAQPACFVRRAAVLQAGCLDTTLHYMMDAELLLKIMANGKYQHIPDVLVNFRIHPHAKSHRAPALFAEDALTILQRIRHNRTAYPALQSLSDGQLRARFYRWASKFLYMGGDFNQSLRYLLFAASADPASRRSILTHEGIRWLIRRTLPVKHYMAWAASFHTWRRSRQMRGGQRAMRQTKDDTIEQATGGGLAENR